MARAPMSLSEQADALLDEYGNLNKRAEIVLEQHVSALTAATPGVPRNSVRQVEIDARARGYSYELALEILRERL